MPRIDDNFLDSVFYVYPSQYDAIEGEKVGGCGFFVSVQSEKVPSITHLYAVTNAHVIRHADNVVLRVNIKNEEKKFETIETEKHKWICHPDGDDVAIYYLMGSITNDFQIFTIGSPVFVNDQIIKKLNLGAGDDVFMVGKFVNHDGKQKNLPTVRFGNIAMMPLEPIEMPTGIKQEAFLIEVRSLPGYSGSPVFWQIPDFSRRPSSNKLEARQYRGLLGIDAGHFESRSKITNSAHEEHPDKWQATLNSGMAIVVPAWKILDLLDNDEAKISRNNWDKETIEEARKIKTEYEDILKQVNANGIPEEHKDEIQKHMQEINNSLKKWLEDR